MQANHSGVFDVFASGEGDVLTEAKFETEAAKVREGSKSIEKDKGWYSEDTTLLSLYVYTTIFELNPTQFSNKVPISIDGLATPQDKSQFYSTAVEGHLMLDLTLRSNNLDSAVKLDYITNDTKWAKDAKEYKLYAVPNVSIQDTTF